MSKLDLSVIMPEVEKILTRAEDHGLETEVIAQMIVNAHNKKEADVIPALWGALVDWDISTEQQEHIHSININTDDETT